MATQMHEDFSRGQTVEVSGNRAFGWVFVVVLLVVAAFPLRSEEHTSELQSPC